MECVGALDQGTQSTRFFLFNHDCEVLASHQVHLPQIYPHAGLCEHDPLEIWRTVQECVTQCCQEAEKKLGPLKVLSIGITNQRETTVVWNKTTGLPLHNAIVWLDTRTQGICTRLERELGGKDFFRPVCGLPISTYFSATKYLWLCEEVPAVRQALEAGEAAIGTVDSWLIWQLTGGAAGGVHVTDVTNASRTMLMELETLSWHPPTLERFHVPASCLPRIVSNSEVYGHMAEGPLKGVPIAGCLGDQMAALLGQRCTQGEAKNTYGTGCFLLLNTGPRPMPSSHGLLTTMAFKLGPQAEPQYALEGSVAVAGLGISWLKDNLGMLSSGHESEAVAASVPNTGGVYFVPAFSGLLAPRWRRDARGALLGMTTSTKRAHVVRAMLEAICFQTREVADAMRWDAGLGGLAALRVDGGATQNDLLMQLQADILQVPVMRPAFQETTSLGAALAAGLAVGFWTHAQVFSGHGSSNTVRFDPSVSAEAAQKRYSRWNKAVERSLDLADLAEDES